MLTWTKGIEIPEIYQQFFKIKQLFLLDVNSFPDQQ